MRAVLIVVGLILIALSAAWFATDLPTLVHDKLTDTSAFSARNRSAPGFSWDNIKIGLDVANAVIGCLGIYLTLRGRSQSQSM